MTGHIYFLFVAESLVYIGQTTNLRKRLKYHEIEFDTYKSIECDPDMLSYYEKRWINKFNPPLNSSSGINVTLRRLNQEKQYPVKMDIPLWDRLENRAADDKRSVNQTIILAIEKLLES